MTVDPTTLSKTSNQGTIMSSILRLLRELYTFTSGNEYLTLGAALQITTSPAGTPTANTLYKGNIVKGWVNIDSDASTAVAADSFNVASIDDDGTGLYGINWDQDFASANYAIAGMAGWDGSGAQAVAVALRTLATTHADIAVTLTTVGLNDRAVTTIIAIGDQ